MTLRDDALALAAKGMRIFPCMERGKEPAIKDNLKRATVDVNLISGWWQVRLFNIGIATGEGSGIWVLDIDGDEGESTLHRLEAEHDALPPTVEALTGKGRHLYWRWPTGVEIRNRQVNPDLPGIDVRGNGGYVLAPHSIHPSGRAYAWSVDSNASFEDAPEWLLELIKGGPRQTQGATPREWYSFLDDMVDGSRRGAAVARLYGLLVRRYIDPTIAMGIIEIFNEARCQPPLDRHEMENIAADIAHREAERIKGRLGNR